MMVLRICSAIAGVGLLAAASHAVIVGGPGYGSPQAYVIIALAIGLAVGAVAMGAAWAASRRALAVALVLAMLAGEAFGLLMTAERVVTSRDAAQVPIKAAAEARARADAEVADAERELTTALLSSARLDAALVGKRAADRAVQDKASERGCAANCRALLEQQVSTAAAEVEAARTEATARLAALQGRVDQARQRLASMPAPASAAPLADRLGVPGWTLDLTLASLLSIGVNGLGAALLALAGKGARRPENEATMLPAARSEPAPALFATEPVEQPHGAVEFDNPAPALPPPPLRIEAPFPGALQQPAAVGHVAAFACELIQPARSGRVPLRSVRHAYVEWCHRRGEVPVPAGDFAEAMADLALQAGIEARMGPDNHPMLIGVRVDGGPSR